jgi:hypothetical protein
LEVLLFLALICVISLALRSPVSFSVYNQCRVINLTSPVYFLHGGNWHILPEPEIDVNAVMRNYLEFDSGQDMLEGDLVYKIQRKHTESDKSVQGESKHIWLLVAWHVKHKIHLNARIVLVEHDKELDWDEDQLRRLYQKCWQSLDAWVNPVLSNWLLDNATMLETTIREMAGGYGWDIFISEESIDDYIKWRVLKTLASKMDNYVTRETLDLVQERYEYIMRPLCIDAKR